jgi:hypothetical protein
LVITDNAALVLKHVVGLPVQLVSGYTGTAPIRLAAESGEFGGRLLAVGVDKANLAGRFAGWRSEYRRPTNCRAFA